MVDMSSRSTVSVVFNPQIHLIVGFFWFLIAQYIFIFFCFVVNIVLFAPSQIKHSLLGVTWWAGRKTLSFDSLWCVSEHSEILWYFQISKLRYVNYISSVPLKTHQNTCSKLTLVLFSVQHGLLSILMFLILPSNMGITTECNKFFCVAKYPSKPYFFHSVYSAEYMDSCSHQLASLWCHVMSSSVVNYLTDKFSSALFFFFWSDSLQEILVLFIIWNIQTVQTVFKNESCIRPHSFSAQKLPICQYLLVYLWTFLCTCMSDT